MPLQKESLYKQITNELKKRIINVEIKQGEKISPEELEEEFGVSKAPIRDALKSLSDQGLVEVKPRVGYFAVELSSQKVKDICELRKLFETYALNCSFKLIPETKVNRLYEKSLQLKDSEIPQKKIREKFDEIDEELHWMFIEFADNHLLKDFTNRINNLVRLTRHLNERIEEANEEHIRLIEALQSGDKDRALKFLNLHLIKVEQEILSDY